MRNQSRDRYRTEFQREREADSPVVLLAAGALLLSVATDLVARRFSLRPVQMVELGLYLLCALAAVVSVVWYAAHRKLRLEKSWPHPPVFVPMLRDRKLVARGARSSAVLAGYDLHGQPWYWGDQRRRMQAIVLGQSGSGKSTLLHNIAAQDIHRSVLGRRLPVIVFDGKGDQEFLRHLSHEACAAGRLDQLRIIDPFRPEISSRFNPLFAKEASAHQELVAALFDSFALEQNFFAAHQATYLGDICRVLHLSSAIYNILDVLVMARDELVMKEQIVKAQRSLETGPPVSPEKRRNFEMSARNLLQSLADRERVPKIQGLLNELMTFTEDNLSVIVNAYEDLLTLEEVIDRQLILLVSLNASKNARAVTALGRILLQKLQLVVGSRYLNREHISPENQPLVSVILDEFAPFAYPKFAYMLQTARGSNVALLFSLQSIPQLRSVGRSFADDVSSAPNTVMLLRTRDEDTASYFRDASSRVAGQRRTMTIERLGIFREGYREIGSGTVTEIEKTRAVDYQIKNLPVGQMQVLTTDDRAGTLHLHLHVRRAPRHRLGAFEPPLYPKLRGLDAGGEAANLRFKNPELVRRMGRIFSRSKAALQ